MKKFLLILSLLFSFSSNARQIKIAIIDSGMPKFKTDAKICEHGLIDLTNTDMYDKIGHGSNILGIISEGLNKNNVDYCIYDIKIYDQSSSDTPFLTHLVAYSTVYYLNGVDIINYSSSGVTEGPPETALVKDLISRGIKFIAAVGNNNRDLDKSCNSWPACIPGVISVGNLNSDGTKNSTSNYGKVVTKWQKGTGLCYNKVCMTGSSQATAVETVEQAKKLYKESIK